ncbi:MAG: energy transducer TonB [Spirochaetaceae bacterium]|jgi:protein TonB|nr:energy transducer TonB [Spirochaetaceae bacterium]
MPKPSLLRLLLFCFVAAVHGLILFCWVISIEPSLNDPEPPLSVMKLVDVQEETPPPPPPKPPESPPPAVENAVETIAENMTVVEEVPEEQTLAEPGTITAPVPAPEPETYLAQNKISKVPVFSEGAIKKVLTYPPIAQRSGIEGSVILELFIDREGVVQRVIILKETPAGRGFGEAAAKAFRNQRCTPAESNGVPVAVRYRYPVRFTLTSP